MSEIATAVGNMFAGTSGAVVASCPSPSQSKGKGVCHLFADTAPLARLREEARSNKEPLADTVRQGEVREPQDAEGLADPRESPVSSDRRRTGPDDSATEPAEEETVHLEAAMPAGEVGAATTTSDAVVSSDTAPATAVPGPAEGDVVAASAPAVNAEASLASEHQTLSTVAHASADDGRAFSEVQTGATMESADGQQHSLQSEVTVSVDKGGVEVSARVLVADNLPDDASDNAMAPSEPKAGSEATRMVVADTAAVGLKEQTSQLVDMQAKTAPSEPQVADATDEAGGEVATRLHGQIRSEIQVPAEGSKELGHDRAVLASRASQTPERSVDGMPQEDGQPFSRQDTRAAFQGGVYVPATPEHDKQASMPGLKDLTQPQAEWSTVLQNDGTSASARSAQTADLPGLDAAATKSPVQDVGEQILSSVHASLARADKQVQIRLDPPELGSVLVRLTEQGDQIRGFLEVSRDETRREIEQALPQVLKGLQEAGVQVRRLEVVVSDQPDRGVGREPSQQDAWTQQHQPHSDHQGYRPPNASVMSWSAQTGFPPKRAGRDEPQVQGVQGRIDMLV